METKTYVVEGRGRDIKLVPYYYGYTSHPNCYRILKMLEARLLSSGYVLIHYFKTKYEEATYVKENYEVTISFDECVVATNIDYDTIAKILKEITSGVSGII